MSISKVLPILLFAIVAAVCPPAFGQAPTGSPSPPALALDEGRKGPIVELAEGSFNFGEMYDDQAYFHEFVVKNVGDAPLEIKKVTPS